MIEQDQYDKRLIEQAENEGMQDRRRSKSSRTLMRPGVTFDLLDRLAEERATNEGMPEPKPHTIIKK